jgi:hypothetical protein
MSLARVDVSGHDHDKWRDKMRYNPNIIFTFFNIEVYPLTLLRTSISCHAQCTMHGSALAEHIGHP